jgi:ABC-type transport system involved in Fe-S cluster assembly fused permease/ATPase subunit
LATIVNADKIVVMDQGLLSSKEHIKNWFIVKVVTKFVRFSFSVAILNFILKEIFNCNLNKMLMQV